MTLLAPSIGAGSPFSIGHGSWPDWGSTPTSSTYFTANSAIAYPAWLPDTYAVAQVWAVVTTASGNLDLGIYDDTFVKVASIGSTAVSGTGLKTYSLSRTLASGQYWIALAASNTTVAFRSFNSSIEFWTSMGVVIQASAFALPSTITPAITTSVRLPMFGIANRSTPY